MALVDCHGCGKRVSDVTRMCPYCGFNRSEASDEQVREMQRRRLRDRIYRLKMASYAVMSVFLAAFFWYWLESSGFQQKPSVGPMSLLAVGAVAYVTNRALLFRAKRSMRKMLR